MPSDPLPRVVLASESPRRRELLAVLFEAFEVLPSAVDEEAAARGAATPEEAALRSAHAKADAAVAARPGALVIACDTVVIVDGEALGKPRDTEEALAMVLRLAGREHIVASALAVHLPSGERREAVERTLVRFRPLSREEAAGYVARGESLDKAGAYGIQGRGSLLVERIEGCYFNVVGLPIHRLGRMLEETGFPLLV